MTMSARAGVRVGVAIFLLLMLLAAPHKYVRLENRSPAWTETLSGPIWTDGAGKFVGFEVGGQGALVPRHELFDFRNQTTAHGVKIRRTWKRVPVTERGYVYAGYDLTVVAAYAALAAATGVFVSLTPGLWPRLWAASVAAGVYLVSCFRRPRRTVPAPPPDDAAPHA